MTQPGELLTELNRVTLLLQGQNERWEAATNLLGEQNNYIAQLIETTGELIEVSRQQSETIKALLQTNNRLLMALEKAVE